MGGSVAQLGRTCDGPNATCGYGEFKQGSLSREVLCSPLTAGTNCRKFNEVGIMGTAWRKPRFDMQCVLAEYHDRHTAPNRHTLCSKPIGLAEQNEQEALSTSIFGLLKKI